VHTHRNTIAAPVTFAGRGLHTGRMASVKICPVESDIGIVFRHIDPKGRSTDIRADWRNVLELPLCTCLTDGKRIQVRTVEHLLAAFYGCEIDSALIEVYGNEIPILDGSAKPLVDLIQEVGLKSLNTGRKITRIIKPVRVEQEHRWLNIEPSDKLEIDIRIALYHFAELRWEGDLSPEIFRRRIASARTFGRLQNGILAKCLTFFRRDPLCLGANLNTTLVIHKGQIVNNGGLRMPDELVCHKVLDLMGDLMLGGCPLIGKITGFSTAHRLNRALLAALSESPDAWHQESLY